jgi:methyltransferase (TIGR00027 family)
MFPRDTMSQTEPAIRNISDTACWAALYRARESERPDALFRDPLAQRLAGPRGEQIAAALPFSDRYTWSWVARTYLFDRFITQQVEQGAELVVNLAAGLDARPYRLALPAALRWIEVDLPELISYKEEVLAGEQPACTLQRVRLDLRDVGARRKLFDELGHGAKRALIITEGLLIYWTAEEVGGLAQDLARPASFQRWILDLASPGLLRMLQQKLGPLLGQGGSPLVFGPAEGPEFFRRFGWQPSDVRSLLSTAAKLKRVSLFMRLLAMLPESKGRQGSRPWGGVCLMAKS